MRRLMRREEKEKRRQDFERIRVPTRENVVDRIDAEYAKAIAKAIAKKPADAQLETVTKDDEFAIGTKTTRRSQDKTFVYTDLNVAALPTDHDVMKRLRESWDTMPSSSSKVEDNTDVADLVIEIVEFLRCMGPDIEPDRTFTISSESARFVKKELRELRVETFLNALVEPV